LGSHAKKIAIQTNSCSSDYMLQHVGLTKRLHSPFVISQLKAFLVLKSSIEYVSGKMRIWLSPIPPLIFYEYINTSKCTCWEVLGNSGVVLVAFMLTKHHICIMDCLQDLYIRNTEFSEFQQGCWWAPQEATVN
jgi:hypothetical protein